MIEGPISGFHPNKCEQLSSVSFKEMAFTKTDGHEGAFFKQKSVNFLNSVLWEMGTFSVSVMGVSLFLTCLL